MQVVDKAVRLPDRNKSHGLLAIEGNHLKFAFGLAVEIAKIKRIRRLPMECCLSRP